MTVDPCGAQITINPMTPKRCKILGKDTYVRDTDLNYKCTHEQFLNWIKSNKNHKYMKNIIDTKCSHNAINNIYLFTD